VKLLQKNPNEINEFHESVIFSKKAVDLAGSADL